MEPCDFIDFINQKSGLTLSPADIDRDLSELEEWDSLIFVYMLIEIENKNQTKINIEKILSCRNLREIMGVIENEIK